MGYLPWCAICQPPHATIVHHAAASFPPHFSVMCVEGFEELARLLSGSNDQTLSPHKGEARFDSENYPVPLVPTEAMSRSRMFGSAPAELIKAITTENITMNNHGKLWRRCARDRWGSVSQTPRALHNLWQVRVSHRRTSRRF